MPFAGTAWWLVGCGVRWWWWGGGVWWSDADIAILGRSSRACRCCYMPHSLLPRARSMRSVWTHRYLCVRQASRNLPRIGRHVAIDHYDTCTVLRRKLRHRRCRTSRLLVEERSFRLDIEKHHFQSSNRRQEGAEAFVAREHVARVTGPSPELC